MSEKRSDEATQIINRVTIQPHQEREGAIKAQRARALLKGYTGEEAVPPEWDAEISAGVLQGLDISTIVGGIVDGKSFLPSEQPQRKVTARGQATVRTPSQIILGIVRATGESVTQAERHDLATGRRSPGQIIEKKLSLAETRVTTPVPGAPRVIAHHAGRPTHKHRR